MSQFEPAQEVSAIVSMSFLELVPSIVLLSLFLSFTPDRVRDILRAPHRTGATLTTASHSRYAPAPKLLPFCEPLVLVVRVPVFSHDGVGVLVGFGVRSVGGDKFVSWVIPLISSVM